MIVLMKMKSRASISETGVVSSNMGIAMSHMAVRGCTHVETEPAVTSSCTLLVIVETVMVFRT